MIEFTIIGFILTAASLFILGAFAGTSLAAIIFNKSNPGIELKDIIESYSIATNKLENKIAELELKLGKTLKENSEMRRRIYPIKLDRALN